MEDTLETYEKKCEEIRRTNNEYLKMFEEDMSGLSAKTIRRHLNNADFFINGYLLLNEPLTRFSPITWWKNTANPCKY